MGGKIKGAIVSIAFMVCGTIGISWFYLNYVIAYGTMDLVLGVGLEALWPVTFSFMLYGGILGALVSLIKD